MNWVVHKKGLKLLVHVLINRCTYTVKSWTPNFFQSQKQKLLVTIVVNSYAMHTPVLTLDLVTPQFLHDLLLSLRLCAYFETHVLS